MDLPPTRLVAVLALGIALAPACDAGGGPAPEAEQIAPAGGAARGEPAPAASSTRGAPPPRDPPPPPSCTLLTTPPAPAPGAPPADVTVSIDGRVGPHGAPVPVAVDRKLYGVNIADWMPEDYAPAIDPTFQGWLEALAPGVLRWPAGHRSQEYVWARGGAGQSGGWTLAPELVDAFVALAKKVSAEPLLAVNVKRGTPAAAADLVRYVNVEKKYSVKYFQMGNEPDLTDGVFTSPDAYTDRLIAFADAMHAVDPTIELVGPELLTGAHVGGTSGTVDWMGPILARAGSRFSGLSWHYYPLDSGQPNASSSARISFPHMFQETAGDWPPSGMSFADTVMPALHALRDAHAPTAKVWITEIAEDPGPGAGAGISDTLAAALWTADVYGRYAEWGPGAVLRWIFKSVPEHYYGLLASGDVPRPTYGALWLQARFFGDRFVRTTTTSVSDVAAHAALRSDGALTVMLVNKTGAPERVRLAPVGVCPITKASQLTLTGASLDAKAFTIEGEPLTLAKATGGLVPTAVEGLDTELPAWSARMLVLE